MLSAISFKKKMLVLIAAMSGLFLAALDQSIVGTALPTIVADFNGLNELSWVVTAYLLTSTITVPIAGKLSDIYGRRKLLLVGIVIFIIGSMFSGLSWNMSSLIAFRAIQGIGGGILMSSAFSVIGDLFVPSERGKWQGVFGAVFGLSSVVGPLLGGYLTDNASWRWCFYLNIPIAIIAFALIYFNFPTIISKDIKTRIDYFGAVLLTGGLGALLLAFTWGGSKYSWLSFQIIGLFTASIILLAWLAKWEIKFSDPIIPMYIFKNSIFRVSVVLVFLIGIAMFGAIIYLPLFAQVVQGASATNSGIILLPLVISLVIASIASGQIITRTGKYKILAIVGIFITTGSLFWLSTLTSSSSHTQTVIRMIPLGIGIGIAMPLFNLVVQNAFPQQMLGVASSSVQLFRGIGATVGVAVMGTYMNTTINNKIVELNNIPFTKTIEDKLGVLDANSLQHVLSAKGQAQILNSISQLPSALQPSITASFYQFVHLSQSILSSAITRTFFLGACLLLIACVAVFFLKEIPLRKSNGERVVES